MRWGEDLYAKINSLGLEGVSGYVVEVEVDSRRGLPGFDIVGLPDATIKESRDRIRSAIQNLGYPTVNSKIVANLAPADKKKLGSVYDLPIVLALLFACGYESYSLDGIAAIGEIGLSGEIRGVSGVLPMVLDAAKLGIKRILVPTENLAEASVADNIEVLGCSHLKDVIDYLNGAKSLEAGKYNPTTEEEECFTFLDFADVKGQWEAKRAMEVAAAGGHNILLIGSPGTGKSMLAKRLPSILPKMSKAEAIETTKIYSVSGLLPYGKSLLWQRPFRAPHHSVSPVALTGGTAIPKPGDVSLAHNGVLFLDEMPEFPKQSLEVLRQPIEDGEVLISRVQQRVTYPSRTMLVAAMNPCPCGYYGAKNKECSCSPMQISRYLGRISGPMLDRIDIQIEMQPVNYQQMKAENTEGSSAEIRQRVAAARALQQQRYKKVGITSNSQLPPALLQKYCVLDVDAEKILKTAFISLGLSARGYDRILKVARTIADLDSQEKISSSHLSQAIQFRSLDRKYWNA